MSPLLSVAGKWLLAELLWPVRFALRSVVILVMLWAVWSWWLVPTVDAQLTAWHAQVVSTAHDATPAPVRWLLGIGGGR